MYKIVIIVYSMFQFLCNCLIFMFQEAIETNVVTYFENCAREDGMNGILRCGAERFITTLKSASLEEDVEVFPGIHFIRYLYVRLI